MIALGDASGARIGAANSYDEYGQRGAGDAGRFQYTGQPWLTEVGLYHFNARAYAPTLGRFLQADPILHAGGMNLYAYVGNDPVNFIDPLGLADQVAHWDPDDGRIIITARRGAGPTFGHALPAIRWGSGGRGGGAAGGGGGGGSSGGVPDSGEDEEIIVEGEEEEVAPRPGLVPVQDSTPIDPFAGCVQGFNICHARAFELPLDSDANEMLRNCRVIVAQCQMAVRRGNGTIIWMFPRASAFVGVRNGRSVLLYANPPSGQ